MATTTSSASLASLGGEGSPTRSAHPKASRRQAPKAHVAHRAHTKRSSMGGSHSNLVHLAAAGGSGPRRSDSGGSRKKGLDALGLGMAAVRPPSTTSMGQVMTASTGMKRGASGGPFVSPDRPRMARATSHSSVGSQGSRSKLRLSDGGRVNGRTTKGKAKAAGGKAGAFKGALEDEDDDEEEEEVIADEEVAPQEDEARRGRPNGHQQPARPPSAPPEDSVLAHRANVPGVPPAALSTAPIGDPPLTGARPGQDEDEWVSEPSTRAPSNAPTRPPSAAPTPSLASRTLPAAMPGISRSGVPSPLTITTPRRRTDTSVPPSPGDLDDDSDTGRGRERVRGRSTSRTRAEEEARAQRAAREMRMSRSRSRNSGGGGVRALSQRAASDSPAGNGAGGRRQLVGKGSPFAEDRGPKAGGATPVRAPSVASAKTTEIVAAEPQQPSVPTPVPAPQPQPQSHRKASALRKAPSSGSLRSTHSFAGFGNLGSGDRGSVKGPSQGVLQPQLDRSQVVVSLSVRDDNDVPAGDKGKAKARGPQRFSLQGVQWDQQPTSATATGSDQQPPRKGPAGTLTPSEAAALAQRLRKTSAPTAPGSGGSDGSATSPPVVSPRRLRKTSGYFGSLRSLVGLAVPEEDDDAASKPKVDAHKGLQRAVTAPLGMTATVPPSTATAPSTSTGTKKNSAPSVATAPVTRRPAPLISKFISPSETDRHPMSSSPASSMRFPNASSTIDDSATPRRAYSGAGLSRTQQRMLLQRDAPIAPSHDDSTAAPAHVIRNLGQRPGPVPMMPLAAAAATAAAGPSGHPHHSSSSSHLNHVASLPQPGQHNLNAPAMRARYAQIFERWLGALMDEAERVGREHETASRWRDPIVESFARVASAKNRSLKAGDAPGPQL